MCPGNASVRPESTYFSDNQKNLFIDLVTANYQLLRKKPRLLVKVYVSVAELEVGCGYPVLVGLENVPVGSGYPRVSKFHRGFQWVWTIFGGFQWV